MSMRLAPTYVIVIFEYNSFFLGLLISKEYFLFAFLRKIIYN